MEEIDDNELLNIIKQISLDVYEKLGFGHSESLYQSAMEVDLRILGIKFESQVATPIYYKNYFVGYEIPDLIINDRLIVELKTQATSVNGKNKTQIDNYIRSCLKNIKKGIIVNFSPEKVEFLEVES